MGSCASTKRGKQPGDGAPVADQNAVEAYGSRITVEVDESGKKQSARAAVSNEDTDEDERPLENLHADEKDSNKRVSQPDKEEDETDDAVDDEKENDEQPEEEEDEEEVEEDNEVEDDGENVDQAEGKEDDEEEEEADTDEEEDDAWWQGGDIGIDETTRKIIEGSIDFEIPSQVKLVRIFTSSTFTDTFVERNNLMERVYPKLKEYCQSIGYDFQVVDMRWGVRDEATDDHMTSELCMRELRACQKLSTGPNFITFLGQKYGYRPFPPKIVHTEFESMLSKIEKAEDKDLLTKWFVKDENLDPVLYILQPVRNLIPNYNNREVNADERSKASGEWWTAFERMQVVLRDASKKALSDQEEIDKYRISVTEDEIRRGILRVKEKGKHCYWFKRNITDLKDQLEKGKARMFIDKTSSGLDNEAVSLLENLRGNLMKKLPKANVTEYDVQWVGEGCINPNESDKHKDYIDKLCKDFYSTLVEMINKAVDEKKKLALEGELVKEISLHATSCQDKSRVFFGREDVLDAIMSHVDKSQEDDYSGELDPDRRIMVVHGASGCGKTSIMAVAAKKIKEKYPDVPIILRFLGTTSESSSISKVLYNICKQLCYLTSKEIKDIPESFKKMTEFFGEELKSLDKKLVIILDSLDQLSPEDGALAMKWLPKEVSHNVSIILSTLPGEKYKVLPALKYQLSESAFINVPVMPKDTAGLILDAWLQDAKHKVTSEQRDIIMKAFDLCPLPLFLKLSFDEAVRWKSYSPKQETLLKSTVKESINELFSRLERLHGKMLVSRSLAYITAAKNGLSDAELDDILSIDDDVLNDVYQYWTPPVRRIPPLLWIRIKTDLGSYVVSRGADGVLINTWYHRQFIETARERYINSENESNIHDTLADYFLGKWSGGKIKPFTTKQGDSDEKDRLVPAQPNIFPKHAEQTNDVYNYRKLNELPRHLIKSGNLDALRDHVVFNFDFLSAKLCAFGLRNVLSDFNEALDVFKEEKEMKLLRDCLQMSGKGLLADPHQLAAQLNGRLSDVKGHRRIHDLIEQSRSANVPCLYPSLACFEKPGGQLVHSLAGHTAQVLWAEATKDGKKLVTTSQNNVMKTWDLDSGSEIRSYDVPNYYSVARYYNDEKGVILAGFSGFIAMDLETEEIAYQEEYLIGQYGTCLDVIANGTKAVHAGGEKISVFGISGKDVKPCWSYEEKAIENNSGFYDTICGGGNYLAYTRGNMKELTIRKGDDKDYIKKLKVPYSLIHFKFNENGTELVALGSNSKMNAQYKDVNLVIWDTSSWHIVKDSPSKFDAMMINVYEMQLAKLESGWELIWPTLLQINFWNVETGYERVGLKSGYQGNQYKQAICADGKHLVVVSMDANQRAVQVYDLDAIEYIEGGDKHLSAIEKTKSYVGQGEREAFMVPWESSIALSIPPADPVVTIWDLNYLDRLRRVTFEGIFPSAMQYISEKHLAIWEYNQRKIFLVNYIDEKVDGQISGKVGEDAPSTAYTNTWQYMGDYQFLAVSENGKDINRWNLKTGELISTIKIGESNPISSMLVCQDQSHALVALKDYSGTTVPAICVDLKANKKVGKVKIDGQRIDLRPEATVLSPDGRTFIFLMYQNYLPILDTATGKEKKKLLFKPDRSNEEEGYDYDESNNFNCISSSAEAGYIAACISGVAMIDGTYTNCHWLACFDINTHELLVYERGFYYMKMQSSKDGSRLLCVSQPVGEESKSIEIWDMSKVRQKKMKCIAKFIPETDLRFSYLTHDGHSVIVGIAGIDGLVFLNFCGGDRKMERQEDCKESKIAVAVEAK